MLDARTVHIADVQIEAEEFPEASENARRLGFHTMLSVPLMREGVAIGAIQLPRTEVRLFTERQVALLKTFADQAVIAIENVRLFNDTKEALERQTATAEILRVISSSPTDMQPVFEAIIRSAVDLCGGIRGSAMRLDGGQLHVSAHFNMAAETVEIVEAAYPRTPTREFSVGRAIVDRTPVHVFTEDAVAREFPAWWRGPASAASWPFRYCARGSRSERSVSRGPTRACSRTSTSRFSRLSPTQAVIVIENVRLFKELEASNREIAAKSRQLESPASTNPSSWPTCRTSSARRSNAIIGYSEMLQEEARDLQQDASSPIWRRSTPPLNISCR